MAQPTIQDIFGVDAVLNQGNARLEIPFTELDVEGLGNIDDTKAVNILACIVKKAHGWIGSNTDETVNAASTFNASSPASRNNVNKTAFNYNIDFYGAYTEPTFDPDDL